MSEITMILIRVSDAGCEFRDEEGRQGTVIPSVPVVDGIPNEHRLKQPALIGVDDDWNTSFIRWRKRTLSI